MGLFYRWQFLIMHICMVAEGFVTLTPTFSVVREGRSFTFNCTASPSQEGGLVIFRNGVKRSCNVRRDGTMFNISPGTSCGGVSEDATVYRMTIENVTRNDTSNEWYCQVGEDISDRVTLEVQYQPAIDSFRILTTGNRTGATVTENTMVTFTCQVDSFPRADIKIKKDGKVVTQTLNSSHIIRSAQCRDRGNFTCSARNVVGDITSDAIQLHVECLPRVANGSPKDMVLTALVNEDVTIKLEVIAYPKPDFELRKCETTIQVAFDTDPIWDGLMAIGTITLHNIRSDQFGCYILGVHNTEGLLEYKIDLRRKCLPPITSQLDVYRGVGIGVAAMTGIAGFCLILVFIFRKKVALCLQGSATARGTHSLHAAAAAEVHDLETMDHEAEDAAYETPGNKYEDLRERTVEPPSTYEQLRIYQNH